MSYKAGDKFIIEIESVDTDEHGKPSYKIKGFQKLRFSEFKLRSLERPIDDNHIFEVGDIVTYANADGKYAVIRMTTVEGQELCTLLSLDGAMPIDNVWPSELSFTGDRIDFSEAFKRYR